MIQIDKTSKVPKYIQLYTALKRQITEEEYTKAPLTPVRTLAKALSISKNSVDQAYQQLLAEGYIHSIPGSGYYRNDIAANFTSETTGPFNHDLIQTTPATKAKYDFQHGSMDSRLFPWNNWKKCILCALREEESRVELGYQDKQGLYVLRKSLMSHLKRTRGVNCTPEQVIICNGVQESVSILTSLLPSERYKLAVEDPGHHATRRVFARNKYSISPIPVNEKGISLEQLDCSEMNLVYVTPSHQFPTGSIMPVANRNRLLALVDKRNGFAIEDDYDNEFHYGPSIPSLQSLDTNNRVIYLGTFSKSVSPSIRASYMILPARLMPIYHEKCASLNALVPELIQYALYEFIDRGFYARHLRKLVLTNEKKYNALLQLFGGQKYIKPIATNSGVYLMIRMNTKVPHAETLREFEEKGIKLYPTTQYWLNKETCDPSLFLLGYAAMSLDELHEAASQLIRVAEASGIISPY